MQVDARTVLFIVILAVLVWLFVQNCHDEDFEIEPNTVVGGYNSGPAMFELEGPSDPGTDGY